MTIVILKTLKSHTFLVVSVPAHMTHHTIYISVKFARDLRPSLSEGRGCGGLAFANELNPFSLTQLGVKAWLSLQQFPPFERGGTHAGHMLKSSYLPPLSLVHRRSRLSPGAQDVSAEIDRLSDYFVDLTNRYDCAGCDATVFFIDCALQFVQVAIACLLNELHPTVSVGSRWVLGITTIAGSPYIKGGHLVSYPVAFT